MVSSSNGKLQDLYVGKGNQNISDKIQFRKRKGKLNNQVLFA